MHERVPCAFRTDLVTGVENLDVGAPASTVYRGPEVVSFTLRIDMPERYENYL